MPRHPRAMGRSVSIRVMSDVWKHSSATGADLLVMLALADFSNDQGESYPSLKIIAQKARLSVRGVCKILDRRQAAGEIERHRSKGGKNRRTRYFINLLNSEQHSENAIQRMAYSERDDVQTVNGGSHALNRHRTVSSKGRSKAAPPPNPQVTEFKVYWAELYRNRFGVEYLFDHGKDGKHIRDLLGAFDPPALKSKAEQFFDGDDEWTQTKGGFTIGVFRTQINRLNSIRTKKPHNYEQGMFPAA